MAEIHDILEKAFAAERAEGVEEGKKLGAVEGRAAARQDLQAEVEASKASIRADERATMDEELMALKDSINRDANARLNAQVQKVRDELDERVKDARKKAYDDGYRAALD